jgi:hypothetical protein
VVRLAEVVALLVATSALSVGIGALRALWLAPSSRRKLVVWSLPVAVLGAALGVLSAGNDGGFVFVVAVFWLSVCFLVGAVLMVPSNVRPIGRTLVAAVTVAALAFSAAGFLAGFTAG